jgi:LDH2 family malate/lactate/ureidoglycolate dehydrogenase
VALNPALFAGGFNERMGDLMHQMRSLPHVDPALPVLVPGGASPTHPPSPTFCCRLARTNADMGVAGADPEKAMEEKYKKEGIAFHVNLVDALQRLAADLRVDPLPLRE